MPGQDERGVHYPSNGLARGRYAVVHDNQTDHRQLSFIDRLKPDFGFKKIGGFYILYESKEFNLILGPDYFGNILHALTYFHFSKSVFLQPVSCAVLT